MNKPEPGSDFWNERFADEQYAYGKAPNSFVKETLAAIESRGKVLFPAEGEGRNAVYAAIKGWDVHAFDTSSEGRRKALELADEYGVIIQYDLYSYTEFNEENTYDLIVAIFNHMPPSVRAEAHRKYVRALKPGGLMILEGFNKKQLGNTSGGPKSLDMLLDIQALQEDFSELNLDKLTETTRVLSEGPFHSGHAELIQFIGTKNE